MEFNRMLKVRKVAIVAMAAASSIPAASGDEELRTRVVRYVMAQGEESRVWVAPPRLVSIMTRLRILRRRTAVDMIKNPETSQSSRRVRTLRRF